MTAAGFYKSRQEKLSRNTSKFVKQDRLLDSPAKDHHCIRIEEAGMISDGTIESPALYA